MTARQEHPHGRRVAGRDDAVIRGPHRHYCSICGNDWSHESHCLEGRTVSCPWCAHSAGGQAQGARTGPHFHDCPSCGKTWRHSATCAEPFRMSLPDCPGCLDSHDVERDSQAREPRASRGRRAGHFRALVKPCALSFLLTAGVILAYQHGPKTWPLLWTTPQPASVQLPEQSRAEFPSTSIRPGPPRGPAPSVAVAKRDEPAWTMPPSSSVQRSEPPRGESPSTSIRPDPPRGPAPSVAVAKRHEPAWTMPPSSSVQSSQPPRAESPSTSIRPSPPRGLAPSVAVEPQREPATIAPGTTASSVRPDVAPRPSASPSALPASPPEPERAVASPAETTLPSPTVRTSVAEPFIPGGPPAGVLGGGSSWETLPDHHPRPNERRTRLDDASRD
jgi:hypothetical protein